MIRVFVACDLSSAVRERLVLAQQQLRHKEVRSRVSWVRSGNLHLSLQFIGLVGEEFVESIGSALAAVASDWWPFSVPVRGLGAFPGLRRARVLWAGCRDPDNQLSRLAAAIQQDLEPLGFPPEQRPFAAHITLGRIRRPQTDPALTAALSCLTNEEFGMLQVDAVHLFQSQLLPDGAIYSKLSSHPLIGKKSPA